MAMGIYKLWWVATSKVYIGQSENMWKRYKAHLVAMKNGSAPTKLQEAYNLYGTPMIKYLEKVTDTKYLTDLERHYIRAYNSVDNGFNTVIKDYDGFNENSSQYPKETYISIMLMLINSDYTLSEIANEHDVSVAIVKGIFKLQNHRWLKNKYPKEYEILESISELDRPA